LQDCAQSSWVKIELFVKPSKDTVAVGTALIGHSAGLAAVSSTKMMPW
jgi:hypothetical protein